MPFFIVRAVLYFAIWIALAQFLTRWSLERDSSGDPALTARLRSPSELAQEMRALVKEQLEQGKSPEEIRKFFVSKYGDWVLLAPPAKGFGLLLWLLPAIGAVLGVLLVIIAMRRWVGRSKTDATAAAPSLSPTPPNVAPDNDSQREFLREERERIETEEKEIEFDFQSGKLSDADYAAMRRRLAAEAAAVGQKLASLPQQSAARVSARKSTAEKKPSVPADRRGPSAGR